MKVMIIASMLLIVLSANFQIENNILILNDNNFEEALKKFPNLAIKFYAPWCPISKSLELEYIKAAETLKRLEIACAQIDATQNKKASKRASIARYPSIKLYNNETFIEYQGDNTESTIVKFVKRELLPAVQPLHTLEEIEKYKEENKAVVIYFGTNSEYLEIVEKVAKDNDNYIFGSCNNKELYEKLNTSEDKIVLFKLFNELRNDYTKEKITKEDLIDFVSRHANPTLLSFDMATAKIIFNEGNDALFFYRNKNDSKTEELDIIVASLADKLSGKLYIIITDINDGIAGKLAEHFGYTEEQLPLLFILEVRQDKHYKIKEEITKANLLQFIQDWENGKLKPDIKSEEIPETQSDPVYKIVGYSFEDIVLKTNKNVLIKFYSPWCGHCKVLAPIYIKLAEKYKDDNTVLIAEVDATQNEIKGINIENYPTVLLWKGDQNNKELVQYEGDNSFESLEKFLIAQLDSIDEAEANVEVEKEERQKENKEKEDL